MVHGKGRNELKLQTTGATLTSRFSNFSCEDSTIEVFLNGYAIGFPTGCDPNE